MKTNVRPFKRPLRHVFKAVSLSMLLFMLGFTGMRGARWAGKTFFACPIVDITCIDCYSPLVKKELVSFTRSHLSDVNFLSFHAADFYSSLKARFNYVTKITVSKREPVGLTVQINCVKPTMVINETLVLAQDHCVYPRSYFSRFPGVDTLPNVAMPTIHDGMQVTPWVYEGLQKIVPSLNNNYLVTYANPSTIYLVPRTQQRYRMIVANEAVLASNMEQLDGLDEIIKDTLQRGICSLNMLEAKRRSVELDLRFERRVIVRFIEHAKRRGKVS